MSAEQYEEVEEFAPASPGIEEGNYKVTYLKCRGLTVGKYGPQVVHVIGFNDLENETVNYYTDANMSKGKKQRNMVEAFLGRELEDGEVVTPRHIKGKVAEAFVELNAKGYPAIKALTKVRKAAPPKRAPEPVDDEPNPFDDEE